MICELRGRAEVQSVVVYLEVKVLTKYCYWLFQLVELKV